MYKNVVFPLLSRVDPERAHDLTLYWLHRAQNLAIGRFILRLLAGPLQSEPVRVIGLTFPNVLGVAAGFDKDARVINGLSLLGFGHIEVGTLTPRPQTGNPKPRVFRLPPDNALINRMGFPNAGVKAAAARLKQVIHEHRRCVIGVSLGKQKETPLTEAAADYIQVMREIYRHADYLAINISSPNTPGLRELQGRDYLGHLMKALHNESIALAANFETHKRPLLVKLSPDLSWAELDDILEVVADSDLDGIVATNTTTVRDGLIGAARNQAGGLSGRPLAERSTEMIAYIVKHTDDQIPVVGVGGVQTARDAKAKLDAGASLVQLYTGIVYEGPRIAGRILRGLQSGT